MAASPHPTPLDTWITVWGFPPSSVSFVLSGKIVCDIIFITINEVIPRIVGLRHSVAAHHSSQLQLDARQDADKVGVMCDADLDRIVMHLMFRMQASKAVTRNGSVLGGSIMIGITHCSDQSVIDNLQTSVLETSVNSSVVNLSSTLGTTPRSIRPLTQVWTHESFESGL